MSFLLGAVLAHLNAPEQQTAETSAFTEVLTPADGHFIKLLLKGVIRFSNTASGFSFFVNK